MALAIAARRMGCGRRMTVGVPIHNRVDMAARQTTGMFVSTLPLVMELDEDWTAEEFSDALHGKLAGSPAAPALSRSSA
jgi:hypothetical protein